MSVDRIRHPTATDFEPHFGSGDVLVAFSSAEEARRFHAWLSSIEEAAPWNLDGCKSRLHIAGEFLSAYRRKGQEEGWQESMRMASLVAGELERLGHIPGPAVRALRAGMDRAFQCWKDREEG